MPDLKVTITDSDVRRVLEAYNLAASPDAKTRVIQMQKLLAKAGYKPGPADGVIGPKTTRAYLDWEFEFTTTKTLTEPVWSRHAKTFLGLREVPGKKHNPKILDFWRLSHLNFKDDETPWCAGFACAMLEEVGVPSPRSGAARSFLGWGLNLPGPALGSIVIFDRGPGKGHVGFVVGRDKWGNIMVLGGNQGDAVSIKPFSPAFKRAGGRVLGYRWPDDWAQPDSWELSALPLIKSDGKLSTNEA